MQSGKVLPKIAFFFISKVYPRLIQCLEHGASAPMTQNLDLLYYAASKGHYGF